MINAQQSVTLSSTGTYTLSSYVYAYSTRGSAYLSVTNPSGTTYTSDSVTGITNQSVQGGWQRISLTFTASATGTYVVKLVSNNIYSQFNFDGKLTRTTYGNGFYVENEYDTLDRVTAVKYNGVVKFTFAYDASGRLAKSTDNINSKVYTYEYDKYNRLVRAYEKTTSGTLVMGVENAYDSLSRASASKYQFPEKTLNYSITYKELNLGATYQTGIGKVYQYTLPSSAVITYSYDYLERISSKSSGAMIIEYYYLAGSGTSTTTSLISSIVIWDGAGNDTTIGYAYDNVGNITEIRENGVLKQSFVYDKLGQMTRENNSSAYTYRYTYDASGNIAAKEVYPYTTGVISESTLLYSLAYSYGDSTWGDVLTTLNGTNISYDEIGNPTNWMNMNNLVWSGRSLTSIGFDAAPMSGMEFKYNSDGIRTYKSYYNMNTGVQNEYTYVLDGYNIIKEVRTGSQAATLYYYYDESGVCGFNYNSADYYYIKNLQGDVIGISNSSGTRVVSYTYDAWGNPISTTGTLASTIGQINPFRYRSYYYDSETGWYYLNSRYYDPSIGRFINADGLLGVNGGIQGYNMFAYCNNNPVMHNDPSGYVITSYTQVVNDSGSKYTGNITIIDYGFDYNYECLIVGSFGELGQGWTWRTEQHGSSKMHIHIKDGRGNEWSQNEDGSGHDKGSSNEGDPPKWIKEKLKEKKKWDWDDNKNKKLDENVNDNNNPIIVEEPETNDVFIPVIIPGGVPSFGGVPAIVPGGGINGIPMIGGGGGPGGIMKPALC